MPRKFIKKYSISYTISGERERDKVSRKLIRLCHIGGTQSISKNIADKARTALELVAISLYSGRVGLSGSDNTAPPRVVAPGHYHLCQAYAWF